MGLKDIDLSNLLIIPRLTIRVLDVLPNCSGGADGRFLITLDTEFASPPSELTFYESLHQSTL
jgi:hypothetical protein